MTAIHLSALTLQSSDPGRLAGFYRRALGLPLQSTRHGTLQEHFEGMLGGVHFAVLRASARLGGPIVPVFRVADLEAATAALRADGVEMVLKPLDLGEGKRVAGFADPDGNVVRLFERAGE